MNGRKIFVLLMLLAGLPVCNALAIELGDTRAQVEARYDTAPVGDHAKGIAIYHWDVWKMEIHYVNDAVRDLIYTKNDPLSDGDISSILEQNGGLAHWHAGSPVNGQTVSWTRTDGATAKVEPHVRTLSLTGGRMPVAPPPGAAPAPSNQPVVAIISTPAAAAGKKPDAVAPNPAGLLKPSDLAKLVALTKVPAKVPAPTLLASLLVLNARNAIIGVAAVAGLILLLWPLFKPKTKTKTKKEEYPFANGTNGEPLKNERYTVPALETTNWQHFEMLIGEVFRRKGYQVEISSGDGVDDGVDLHLKKEGVLILAQCKRWLTGRVSVGAIREFQGAMTAEKADRGIFIATGDYAQDALNFAKGTEMDLLDKAGVSELIAGATRPGENIYDLQRWLPEFVSNAVITHPDCPSCNTPMVLRGGKGDARYWGCASFPQCKGTRDARLELVGNLVSLAR